MKCTTYYQASDTECQYDMGHDGPHLMKPRPWPPADDTRCPALFLPAGQADWAQCERGIGHGNDHTAPGLTWFTKPKPPADHDEVKTPEHYRFPGGVEVKHLTQHLTFFAGNAVKYTARAGRKAGVDELVDLRKARECIDNEIERIEAQRAAI